MQESSGFSIHVAAIKITIARSRASAGLLDLPPHLSPPKYVCPAALFRLTHPAPPADASVPRPRPERPALHTTREVVLVLNTERTSSDTPRFALSEKTRLVFARLLAALALAGLTATAVQAGRGGSPAATGTVLALAAQLRATRLHAAAASSHTPDGRTLHPHGVMHAGALVSHIGTPASVVPISGGVQTYDVNNPPPAFRPLVGFGTAAALNNSATNPPVYVNALTPTNLTPIWSADETFLIFASNRNADGSGTGVNADGTGGGSRFHLWAISVNGGQAFQITASTGPAGGGEFFPALSRNNLTLAFTSDAASPGTPNLYAFAFSYSALSSSAAAPVNLSATTANPNPPAPLTLRAATEAGSAALTGFDIVQRPTFSPSDDQLLVFSARATSGTYAGHNHLYFLYRSSGGFDANNNVSFPGKLTDGPSDDSDPAYAPDGTFIAFASTAGAAGFVRNPSNAFGPTPPSDPQNPDSSQSLSSSAAATRSLFLISGGGSSTGVPFGTVPGGLSGSGGRISLGASAGFDDYGPAWSSFANQNQYTNPLGNYAYLAFSRSAGSAGARHDIYYFQAATGVSQPSSETLVPETVAGGANASLKLNTDDNGSGSGAGAVAANAYEDSYPTWSPFLSIFSIAYGSNRTVTYNNPAGGVPIEVAASVADGGSVTNAQDATANYSVGANYRGLLVSQVLNLDPPTLLRFSTSEVVHVQAAGTLDGGGSAADPVGGTPNKLAVTGGQKVTLTVRLSDREAGIADTGGPGGGPRVYVQIKDPDSKYKDAQNAEHKVFAKDFQYNGQSNQPLSDVTSGRANASIGTGFPNFESLASPFDTGRPVNKYTYPSYGTPLQTSPAIANRVFPRGAHGGHYFAPDSNNPALTYIFVGKGADGTTNTATVSNPGTGGGPPVTTTLPGTDPNQFIPQGPEYEAQVVNPRFANGDTVPDSPGITVANPGGTIGDYVSPYWLAGVDDQGAFSGGAYTSNIGASALPRSAPQTLIKPNGTLGQFSYVVTDGTTQTDRPTAGYTTGTGAAATTHPAEWLQLARVPANLQDNNGGVLYTVTWQTPNSGSDFYVDVIAYDNAVFPNVPGSTYTGKRTNWRVYDNVGGFSTNTSVGGNDILLVSDYALGQKFAATTFGGRNLNLNLVPKIFGTESYLSDVDVNILPDSEFAGIPDSPTSYYFNPAIQLFSNGAYGNQSTLGAQNGLGVGSYVDNTINDGTIVTDTITGRTYPNVRSQAYSIWRILSRGPVPASLLNSYLPTPVSQPVIADAADAAYKNVPAATILDASRCVIWLSPYTGDVLADPGTIDDPGNVGTAGVTNPRQSTTSILTSFVKNGGRLCVTGQDVGSTLTQGGSVGNTPSTIAGSPNFLPDVLNASLAASSAGVNVLSATANRITGSPFYDNTALIGNANYDSIVGPIQGPTLEVFPVLPFQDNLVLGNADYGDSGLSQVPATTVPGGASVQGQSDVITALNGATTAITYGASGGALVYHDDPFNAAGSHSLPNGGTGSRVVYAGFGLEGLSEDYYSSASPNSSSAPINGIIPDETIPDVFVRNPRTEILHNIVNYLRTGRVSGTITQTAGTGQGGGLGIDGVTVYLRPTGAAPPARAAFSALTANGGRFTIAGVEPGTYTLVALKPGFQRAVSNSNVSFTVEGDVTKTGATLTLTPQQPGNIAGAVKDTAGTLISGATVTFTSQDNSVTKTGTSANGSVTGSTTENYFIQSVAVTTYTGTATGPANPQGLPEYTAATTPDAPNAAGVTVQPNTTLQPVNFTLTPILATISGTVTNAAGGAPVGGAAVEIKTSAGVSLGQVTSAADGTYTLPNVPAAAAPTATGYTITATAPGFAASQPLPESVFLGSVITGQNFALNPIPPGSIKVTVVYAGGAPVAGAPVSYTPPGGTATTVPTGTDGTVTIPSVPPATYSVTASGPSNANGRPTAPAAAAQPVTVTSGAQATATFTLTPTAPSFSGTVTGTTSGTSAPISGAAVTVTGTDASGAATAPKTVVTAADGTYSTGPLAPGTYTLTASKGGFTSSATPAVTVQFGDAGTVRNFALTAVAPGSITGTVKDDGGAAVSGATVVFNSTDGTVTNLTATSAADGSFVIPPPPATAGTVPAATYRGTATGPSNAAGRPAYGAGAPVTVTVPAGGSATASFVLPALLASVSGTVTDAQTGAGVAGATVTLTDPSGAAVGGPVTTGADGSYSFTGIRTTQAGQTYTITVSKAGYFTTKQTVTVSLGDAAAQPISLSEQATLYGLVSDGSQNASGQPLPGVTLTVTDAAGTVVATVPTPLTTTGSAAAGPDGSPQNYSAALVPGTYTITASKGSYDTQTSASFTLTNGAPVRKDFKLVSSIGTLVGLVTDQNGTTPTAGVTVTAVLAGGTGANAGVTFTTTGSATTAPDGSPANYSGQLSKGTYSVTVTKGNRTSAVKTVVVVGGATVRLDFSGATGLPALHTFAAGFQFVSTPYDYSSLGFNGLFGALNTAPAGTTPNGNRSNVAVWNPVAGAYALDPNAPADSLRLGVGYWVFLKNAQPVTQQGAAAPGSTVRVSLGKGWNQIGVPRPTGIAVSDLKFDNGAGSTISFSQAQSSQYNLVTNPLYGYTAPNYQALTSTSVLQPWNAYWIYVNAPATLVLPSQ